MSNPEEYQNCHKIWCATYKNCPNDTLKYALVLFLLSGVFFGLVLPYEKGAPLSACNDLMPQHGVPAQHASNQTRYQLLADKEVVDSKNPMGPVSGNNCPTNNSSGNTGATKVGLWVDMDATYSFWSPPMNGFMVQAINLTNGATVGKFGNPNPWYDFFQLMSCNRVNDTATHSPSFYGWYSEQRVYWEPDPGSSGPIVFRGTIVHNETDFYVGFQSPLVLVRQQVYYCHKYQGDRSTRKPLLMKKVTMSQSGPAAGFSPPQMTRPVPRPDGSTMPKGNLTVTTTSSDQRMNQRARQPR